MWRGWVQAVIDQMTVLGSTWSTFDRCQSFPIGCFLGHSSPLAEFGPFALGGYRFGLEAVKLAARLMTNSSDSRPYTWTVCGWAGTQKQLACTSCIVRTAPWDQSSGTHKLSLPMDILKRPLGTVLSAQFLYSVILFPWLATDIPKFGGFLVALWNSSFSSWNSLQPVRPSRYAVIWTGDNTGSWEYIRMQIPTVIGSGLSGFAHATGDVTLAQICKCFLVQMVPFHCLVKMLKRVSMMLKCCARVIFR